MYTNTSERRLTYTSTSEHTLTYANVHECTIDLHNIQTQCARRHGDRPNLRDLRGVEVSIVPDLTNAGQKWGTGVDMLYIFIIQLECIITS